MVKGYSDLLVWQKAMGLVVEIYELVKLLPKEEMYSLSDQMRRAAVSIPSNIAEGHARQSVRSFIHVLSIAQGSRAELETQLLICVRIGYLERKQIENAFTLCQEIGKMMYVLENTWISKLK